MTEQLDFDSLPLARRTDPATSHLAAQSLNNLTKQRSFVLNVLRLLGPMTDEELVRRATGMAEWQEDQVRVSPSGVRTRRHELVAQGQVRDTGQRVTTRSGRRAIVWEVAA